MDLSFYKEYAEKKGYKLNPDAKYLDVIMKGLKRNREKYGEAYCPCRRVTGDKEADKEIICPCIFHEAEIREQGYCHCRLFFAKWSPALG